MAGKFSRTFYCIMEPNICVLIKGEALLTAIRFLVISHIPPILIAKYEIIEQSGNLKTK